jgi:peroxiredoxin Q/BCP
MPNLQIGDRAPLFSATAHDGSTVNLSDFLGKQGLVLFFYPKDGTPVCTKEVCSFRDAYGKFTDAGVAVVGVSSDSATKHQSFAKQHQLPFPLISDSDGSLQRLFGVSKKLGLIPGRMTFVIDKDGIVRLIYSALFASEEHVRQALQATRAIS